MTIDVLYKYLNMYMYLYMFVYLEICPYTYRYGYNRYGHAGPKHHQGYNNILPFSGDSALI
jgi:hypothetical protein